MNGTTRLARRTSRAGRAARVRLKVERLETRALPAVSWPGLTDPIVEVDPNDTLDAAQDLGTLASQVGVVGSIDPSRPTDVDFYSFSLDGPAAVRLATRDRGTGSPLASVLTLYDTDPSDPVGHRLLAQSDGASTGGDAVIQATLGAGTYFVAVSGSGDRYFNPFLADSGYAGSTGAYGLSVSAAPLAVAPGDGPAVLATDPAPDANLTSSPFALRVGLTAALDPTTIVPGDTVQLTYSPDGNFDGPNASAVPIASASPDFYTDELVVVPSAPLGVGYYRLTLSGDGGQHANVSTGIDGTPLGADALHPTGSDYSTSFRVVGVKGNAAPGAGADDTAPTAHELGTLPDGQIVQVAGAIGNDPTDPVPFNPSDVDLYHFNLSGGGKYAFAAEAFAGRIGSPLDPALTLFRRDAAGNLAFVDGNANSNNDTAATDGSTPLYTDPVLYAALGAGDYYLAVSSGFNFVDPAAGALAGQGGVFDPTVSHSGQDGNSVGPYVLNLKVQRAADLPGVVSVSLGAGPTVAVAPPTEFAVRFSERVNVSQLAFAEYVHNFDGRLPAVYVLAADGTTYYPRLAGYDTRTNAADFLMLDALPAGDYALHLSGPQGLSDLAGNPLAGNDPSGDYVVHFRVGGPSRGIPGDPTTWAAQAAGNDAVATPQVLGTLFPLELQSGVTVVRKLPGAGQVDPRDEADFFQVGVLQAQTYAFGLSDTTGLPPNARPTIWLNGTELLAQSLGNGAVFLNLKPGTYVVGVSWPGGDGTEVSYRLHVSMLGAAEPAAAIATGPAPPLQLKLVGDPPPTLGSDPGAPGTTSGPPQLSLDPGPSGSGGIGSAAAPTGNGAGSALASATFFAPLGDRPLGGPAPLPGESTSAFVSPALRLDPIGPDPALLASVLVLLVPTFSADGVEVAPLPRPLPDRQNGASTASDFAAATVQAAATVEVGALEALRFVEGLAADFRPDATATVPTSAVVPPVEPVGPKAPTGSDGGRRGGDGMPEWASPVRPAWTAALGLSLVLGFLRGRRRLVGASRGPVGQPLARA